MLPRPGIYFTVVSGTTVGFGDIGATTTLAKWVCVLFDPLAVIYMSTQMSQISDSIVGSTGVSCGMQNAQPPVYTKPELPNRVPIPMCSTSGFSGCWTSTSPWRHSWKWTRTETVRHACLRHFIPFRHTALLVWATDGTKYDPPPFFTLGLAGEITEFEYFKFMLTKSGMVDEDTFDALRERFRELDVDDSGALTRADIQSGIERDFQRKMSMASRASNPSDASASGSAAGQPGSGGG